MYLYFIHLAAVELHTIYFYVVEAEDASCVFFLNILYNFL